MNRGGQRGNVFTVLLGGIVLTGTLGIALTQIMGGTAVSTVRIAKQTAAEAQARMTARRLIADAANQTTPDCDNDSHIEPRPWRGTAGAPLNGGYVPQEAGATLTDPWGTDFGYCVWDVGPQNDPVTDNGCGAGVNRFAGSPSPLGGDAVTQTVLLVVSAGPDKTFQTQCAAYTDTTTDVVSYSASPNDDIVMRYTYVEAGQETASLWQLKTGAPDTAIIDKNIQVGDNSTSGAVSALSVTTKAKVVAGGAVVLGDETDVSMACSAVYAGMVRYNTTGPVVQFCNGTAWTSVVGGGSPPADIDALSDGIADYTDDNIGLGLNSVDSTTSGTKNLGIGQNTLTNVTDGFSNVALGVQAAETGLGIDSNVAIGYETMRGHFSGGGADGYNSTAVGYKAMAYTSTPFGFVAVGAGNLMDGSGATPETAVGYHAMRHSYSTGNTAAGAFALKAGGGARSTAVGFKALMNLKTGVDNTAAGFEALMTNVQGDGNTAVGYQALRNTIADDNTGVGYQALSNNFTGSSNAAMGYQALMGGGVNNTAMGYQAMMGGGGDHNTAIGYSAMSAKTSGADNTAVGYAALSVGTTMEQNTVAGYEAGMNINNGDSHTVVGYQALRAHNTSSRARNTAIGMNALDACTDCENQVAVGNNALGAATSSTNNTAVGAEALAANLSGGTDNTAVGWDALDSNTTGDYNTAIGARALAANVTHSASVAVGTDAAAAGTRDSTVAVGVGALQSSTTGWQNNAVGYQALYSTVDGSFNTALGALALYTNVSGGGNTAIGYTALQSSTGDENTAIGTSALNATTGDENTAIGEGALASVTNHSYNTAVGRSALNLTDTDYNTAIGAEAAPVNVDLAEITAVGYQALLALTGDGDYGYVTAVGSGALDSATTGAESATALGASAMTNVSTGGDLNVGVGYNVLATDQTGGTLTGIGSGADVNASNLTNATAIGYGATATASNSVYIGNGSVTTIAAQPASFTATSDARLKTDITDSDLGLAFIMKLRPVSYMRIDGNKKVDYGFIAQEVEGVLEGRKTNMVTQDDSAAHMYRLRHADILAPLVKAVQEQEDIEARQRRDIEALKIHLQNLQAGGAP